MISTDLNSLLPVIVIGLAVLALTIFLIARANRKTTIIGDERPAQDVLDEGAERARRNQALIDAAPAAVKPEASPAAVPEPVIPAPDPTPAPAPFGTDDLSRIKGVGPKLVALLSELGVTTFAQIAAWSEEDINRVDAQLGRFAGRISRDQWVEQAKLLGAGDEAGFTERFGRNT